MQTTTDQQRFCGREFGAQEVSLIMRIVGVETPGWRTQGSGVPGPSGAIGGPGGIDASG